MTDTTQATETKRKAKRDATKVTLIDENGKPTTDDTKAVAFDWEHRATGKTLRVAYADLPAGSQRTGCLFGTKTRLGHVLSSASNEDAKNLEPAAQWDYVNAWFEHFRQGGWNLPRDGGPRIDMDALATAICQVMVNDGKATADQVGTPGSGGLFDQRRKKLTDDETYLEKARVNADVAAAYKAIKGIKEKPALANDEL